MSGKGGQKTGKNKKPLSLLNENDVRVVLANLGPLEDTLTDQPDDQVNSRNEKAATTLNGEELGSKTCQTCGESFTELTDQRQHFKLDWHRFNVKQKLKGEPVITEQEFDDLVIRKSHSEEQKASSQEDDMVSLSGSESEEEEEEEDEEESLDYGKDGGFKVFMVNEESTVISFYKCICPDPVTSLPPMPGAELKWAVLMLGGGHFAAAVFHSDKPVLHKTFHCYTVRAKQGGGQSSADNRSGTSHPKSAGASLRRYNEASLAQHVRDIMSQWDENLKACSLIFYRAAGNNKKLLFTSPTTKEKPVLERKDPRVRSIPFPTRRATFSEVKRIHSVLTTVDVHGPKDEFVASRTRSKGSPTKAASPRKAHIHRSKSRDKSKVKPVCDDLSEEDLKASANENEEDEAVDSLALEIQHQRIIDGLGAEFETKFEDSSDQNQHDLVTACMSGDSNLLLESIQACLEASKSTKFLNQSFGASKSTPLHLAAKQGHNHVVLALLEHGADPTQKDRQKKTPYMMAQTKETRNVFRRFQAANIDAFDWAAAQVPTTDLLTPEEEARLANKKKEKRKAQKQAKKAKDQEERKVQQVKQKEQAEKDHFLRLSDREKRALAAERRLLAQENANVVSQRCFLCAKDITGKVPFEYNDNRFCSPACVRQHRKTVNSTAS